ncbi:hypothetical protein [Jannaschia sp. CCS1]|uniref:hypothetical protein n=1 Tax=Jannaschia sp. (strain CCS1) TaxID=290400 RepID=UPI000053D963|nr:hypothetical protein [Jannaschia sp. CCS1]ABD55303.1 hypothetical protein Jann_2386 [Jannaschia sp. CCS1]
MTAQPTGVTLFFGALGDLIRHPRAVLRLSALPLALFLCLELILARAYVDWFNDLDGSLNPPGEIIGILAFFALLGLLATSWHRLMILGEQPGLLPRLRPGLVVRYILAWIVVGLIVGLIVLVCFGVPVFVLGSMIDPQLGQLMLNVIAPDPYLGTEGGLAVTLLVGAVAVGAGALYLYLLFRMGMGMPSVAVRDGEGMGMRASWRATRGLAGAIAGLVVFALIGQAALFGLGYLNFYLLMDWDAEGLTLGTEYMIRLGYAVVDTLTTLIGAAILTRIYRASVVDIPSDPAPSEAAA